jgi:hypothetical protein
VLCGRHLRYGGQRKSGISAFFAHFFDSSGITKGSRHAPDAH